MFVGAGLGSQLDPINDNLYTKPALAITWRIFALTGGRCWAGFDPNIRVNGRDCP